MCPKARLDLYPQPARTPEAVQPGMRPLKASPDPTSQEAPEVLPQAPILRGPPELHPQDGHAHRPPHPTSGE